MFKKKKKKKKKKKHPYHQNKILCEKCPYSEFFWSVFSRIRTGYGEIMSSYSVRMQENTDQENSKYGHFSRCKSHEKYEYLW